MKKETLICLMSILGSVHCGFSAPNLSFVDLTGWDDCIVVSKVTGTHTDDLITPTDPIYMDWAMWNNGGDATAARFDEELYVDGVLNILGA